MPCRYCGGEIGADGSCLSCGESERSSVRVLSKEEKIVYDGLTVEEAEDTRSGAEDIWYGQQGERRGFHRKVVYGTPLRFYRSSWLSRFVGSLLLSVILLLLFVIVFPLALILAAVGIVVWIVLEFLRRR